MNTGEAVHRSAEMLLGLWQQRKRCDGLPSDIRPCDRKEGYAVQQALTAMQSHALFGWKIAATSAAGQAHIGVDGPLAGSLYTDRVLQNGAKARIQAMRCWTRWPACIHRSRCRIHALKIS